jgi:ABC-type bacteriocin/lantibiotic exporter with double-glycine peptidase domain
MFLMEPKLTRFIWKYSAREQVKVLLFTLMIFPVLYFSLELPKIIINDAITSDIQHMIFGENYDPVDYLLILCTVLFVTVFINGVLKMRINTFKGVIGERMVRRLRYQLISQVIDFPQANFQRISQGEIISTITSETEPLAGFIGESVAQPLFQGGTMITILIFMFMQDPVLGLVSISMIPLQAYIIPKMQRKLNILKKQRVSVVRKLSGQIGESVDGHREIKLHGTQRFHLANFSHALGKLFKIRFDIFQQKYLMKFINNFLNQLPPILFYAIGGILVIQGKITIGALVAALAAYKDLVSPWKELLDYYQLYQDSKVRYEYIQENFYRDVSIDRVEKTADNMPDFNGNLHIKNLHIRNERGDFISQNINLRITPGSHLNIFSDNETLLRKLAMNITNLEPVAAGDILLSSRNINELATIELNKKIAYIGPEPFMIEGTIFQNINYGLRQLPPKIKYPLLSNDELTAINESAASGNSTDSIDELWTDFAMAEVDGWKGLSIWLQDTMSAIGARRMVFEFGLKDYIDPLAIAPAIHDKFSITKEDLFTSLRGVEANELIERFEINQFSTHLSLIENITFGLIDTQSEQLTIQKISNDEQFIALLQEVDLYVELRAIGEKLANHLIYELEQLNPSENLNNQYKFYDVDCVRRELVACIGKPKHLPSCEFLLGMALGLRVSDQGSQWVSEALQSKILALRKHLMISPISILSENFEPLRKGRMNQRLSVMENLLWGFERAPKNAAQHKKLVDIVEQALIENEAEALVLIVIALSQVGIRGERLSTLAKQNIQLIRALIKRPAILMMHNALPARNNHEVQELLDGIKKLLPNTTVIVLSSKPRVTSESVKYYQLDANGLKQTTAFNE